jgi:hypothetical protein
MTISIHESALYSTLLPVSFLLAVGVFITLFFVNAPYGRHMRQGWGPRIPARLGWVVMESPAALVFAACFWSGGAPRSLALLVFLGMWEVHYLYRAFIYPFRLANGRKTMPVVIVLMAFLFNAGNAYLNGRYLFTLSGGYSMSWLVHPAFLVGSALFIAGFSLNHWADRALLRLRGAGETGYQIPYGGFFEWVSCPNYLGEIIEWTGWAVMTWSLPGLSFAVWTFANLAPRAGAHHAWYRARFPEYPAGRKALIPFVW